MVPIQIPCRILELAIDGLMQIFLKRNASLSSPRKVRLEIFYEDGETLSPKSKLSWCSAFRLQLLQHNPGVFSLHLSSAKRVTVAVVLRETEGIAEPGDGFFQVSVHDVRKYGISGYRTI